MKVTMLLLVVCILLSLMGGIQAVFSFGVGFMLGHLANINAEEICSHFKSKH